MTTLLAEAIILGKAAKGYEFGAEGPTRYDCSGLVWRAAEKIGAYHGARFTTWTVVHDNQIKSQFKLIPRAHAEVGDIVVWAQSPTHGHMGIKSGLDQFYSAESVKSGIGYGRISTFHVYPVAPVFLRPIKGIAPAPVPRAVHVVVKGDTLYDIAKAWGVTLTAVEHANPHAGHPAGHFNIIWPGDEIVHP